MLKTPESFHPQSQPHRYPARNHRALAQSLTSDFGCRRKALEFTLLLEASFGTTNKSWPTAFQFPEDPMGTERRPLGRVLHRPAKVYKLVYKRLETSHPKWNRNSLRTSSKEINPQISLSGTFCFFSFLNLPPFTTWRGFG